MTEREPDPFMGNKPPSIRTVLLIAGLIIAYVATCIKIFDL